MDPNNPNNPRKRERPEDEEKASGPPPAPIRPSPAVTSYRYLQSQQTQPQTQLPQGQQNDAKTNPSVPSPAPIWVRSPAVASYLQSQQTQPQTQLPQGQQNDVSAFGHHLSLGEEANLLLAQTRTSLLNNAIPSQNAAAVGGLGQAGQPPNLAAHPLLSLQQNLLPNNNAYSAALLQNALLQTRAVNPPSLTPLQALQARLLLGGSLPGPIDTSALGQQPQQQQPQQQTNPPALGPTAVALAFVQQPGNVSLPVSGDFMARVTTALQPGSRMLSNIPSAAVSAESTSSQATAALAIPPDRDMKLLYTSADDTKLSPYQCLARKQIELYEATEKDLEAGAQGRNRPIVLGQVGIRCRWCATLPSRQRHRASAYYPSQLNGIYQAAQNITNSHLSRLCQSVPQEIRQELVRLQAKKSGAGGGKKYWSHSARDQGVCDAGEGGGLRFVQTSNESSAGEESDAKPTAAEKTGQQEGKEEET